MKLSLDVRLIFFFLFVFFLLPIETVGQKSDGNIIYSEEDQVIFNRLLEEMKGKESLPTGELMIHVGRFFLGTPYVAAALETEKEVLVVNLRELDCMTFVENVLALTQTLKQEESTFERYCYNLQEMRYRNGVIEDYTDRLHYTTDWIHENESRGVVKDVTQEIGGVLYPMQLSFMSTHPDSYKQLQGNSERIFTITEKEKEISSRSYYYIPEVAIEHLGESMSDGDIVSFVTSIKGLDVSHVGLIYRENGKLTFIHASSSLKKVIVNEGLLSEYVARIKNNIGVIITRPQFDY